MVDIGQSWQIKMTDGTWWTIPAVLSGTGTGMMPVRNVVTPYALGAGSFFQRTKVSDRLIYLRVMSSGTSWTDLLSQRKTLINALRPDRTNVQAPFTLRYVGGNKTLEIDVVYDGGLELNDTNGWNEETVIRFLAVDPYWREVIDVKQSLTVAAALTNANYVLKRSSGGTWSAMSTGLAGAAYAIAVEPATGYVFAHVHTSASYKWNGAAWSSVGTPYLQISANAYAFGSDGKLYTGNYDGLANAFQAKAWDGAAWNNITPSAGYDAGAYVASVVSDGAGVMYYGGKMTLANGVAAVNVAKYTIAGGTWSGGMNLSCDYVRALWIDGSGRLYASAVTGSNTTIYYWNGATWTSVATANGLVYTMAGYGQNLLIGGTFTTVNSVPMRRIARYNRTSWSQVGSGSNGGGAADGGVYKIVNLGADEDYLVGGTFTQVGDAQQAPVYSPIARYTSGTWSGYPIRLPGTPEVWGLARASTGDLYFAYTTAGSATTEGVTVVGNDGGANTYPILAFTGPLTVYQVTNETTGERVYFNTLSVASGEVVTLDMSRLTHTGPNGSTTAVTMMSSTLGNVMSSVKAGSNLGTFHLATGNNRIVLMASGAGSVQIKWRERYWSIDGAA